MVLLTVELAKSAFTVIAVHLYSLAYQFGRTRAGYTYFLSSNFSSVFTRILNELDYVEAHVGRGASTGG